MMTHHCYEVILTHQKFNFSSDIDYKSKTHHSLLYSGPTTQRKIVTKDWLEVIEYFIRQYAIFICYILWVHNNSYTK